MTKTLVALLHLSDSLFPLGAFGHSDGLEAATAAGLVRTPGDLGEWLDVCLDEAIGRTDGPALLRACAAFSGREWPRLAALDQEVTALRPSSAARRSSRAMGLRLATTWHALYPDPGLEHAIALAGRGILGPTLPVAFGCACASVGVEPRDAVASFAYTRLASTISAAMRLMPIGQTDAHAQLTAVLRRVPAVIDAMATRTRIESFSPAMDIALMSQQHLHSRLFRS
jgi:urease accessory protein